MKEPTRAPIFACMYPGLCDIARKHGYALAVHGTVTTDLDLIAVPWVDDAGDRNTLREALMTHIGACGYADLLRRDCPHLTEEMIGQIVEREQQDDDGEAKPHGRRTWNLYLVAGTKVDLSVLPKSDAHHAGVLAGMTEAAEIMEKNCQYTDGHSEQKYWRNMSELRAHDEILSARDAKQPAPEAKG